MKRLIERLKNEPVFVGQLLALVVDAAIVFGLDLTVEQVAILMGAVHLIAGGGSRQLVSPTRKIREETNKLKPFDPDLRARRGRQA